MPASQDLPPSAPGPDTAPDLRSRLKEAAEQTEHLKLALASNRRIGILMRERRCSEEQAFDALRRASMQRNVKLRDIAESVIDSGTL
jgi:AmiR/NasT family two-component response regulator